MSFNGGRSRASNSDLQVLVATGTLIVLLIAGVATAVWLILGLRQETTRFTERQLEYVGAIRDIELASKALANDERGYLISGSPEFLGQMEGRTAQVEEAFARAFANSEGEQWQAVERAEESFRRWLEATNANLGAYQRGDRDAAVEASLNETRSLRKEYEARLAGTHGLAAFSLEVASAEMSATLTRSIAILLTYLAVAVVVGIAIAVWLIRRTVRPMSGPLDDVAAAEQRPPSRYGDPADGRRRP